MKMFTWIYVIVVELFILWLGNYVVETFHTTNYMRLNMHGVGWPPALILLFYLRRKFFRERDENE